jgi:hypothetical protein
MSGGDSSLAALPDPTVTEVKRWLRGCHHVAGLSMSLSLLFRAYKHQGGQCVAHDFYAVVLYRCPGLRTSAIGKTTVVHGIAPRGTADDTEGV